MFAERLSRVLFGAGVAGAIVIAGACGSTDDDAAPSQLEGTAEQGRSLVREHGCQSCHSTSGADGLGPTWEGLAGADVPLADGRVVVADEEYLRRSITDPSADIVGGFPDLMPSFNLDPDEIGAIVAYIESLADP